MRAILEFQYKCRAILSMHTIRPVGGMPRLPGEGGGDRTDNRLSVRIIRQAGVENLAAGVYITIQTDSRGRIAQGARMFGIGFQEMLIILVVVLIFFGPKRLPDLAKSLGKGIAEFKKASEEVRKGIEEAVKEESPPEASKTPEPPAAGTPKDPETPPVEKPPATDATPRPG